MKKISAILLLALLLLGLSACTGAQPAPTVTAATEPPVSNPVDMEFKGSQFTYKILGVRATAKSLFNPIPSGEQKDIYFIVFVQITNTSDRIQSVNSLKNFGLKDKNGHDISQVFDANNYNQPDYNEINPGDTKRGEIAYKIAADAAEMVFLIKDDGGNILYTADLTVPALEETSTAAVTPTGTAAAPSVTPSVPAGTTQEPSATPANTNG